MTILQDALQSAAIGVGVTQTSEDLNILTKPGCAAAIWHRQTMPAFQSWINGLDPDNLPSARLILQPQNVQTALMEVCDAARMPDGPYRHHLIADISALVDVFCGVMKPPFVRLRLDRVTTNACRRFHIDAVTARLVCTYRGTGTQYGISINGAEPARIYTVPTGAPILLRGTLWPEQPHSDLVHRSPPIEGSGATRLVLVLDPIFDRDAVI